MLAGKREPHVKPINDLVDRLQEGTTRRIPHVAPTYGGVGARALFLFRDPGPATIRSKMLCHQNDDQSAQRFSAWLDEAGISSSQVLTWNAYPWYINDEPRDEELSEAAPALAELLALMRDLRVIVLCGRRSEDAWEIFRARFPANKVPRRILPCPHSSHMGLLTYGGKTRTENVAFAKVQFAAVQSIISE